MQSKCFLEIIGDDGGKHISMDLTYDPAGNLIETCDLAKEKLDNRVVVTLEFFSCSIAAALLGGRDASKIQFV